MRDYIQEDRAKQKQLVLFAGCIVNSIVNDEVNSESNSKHGVNSLDKNREEVEGDESRV